MNLFGLPNYGIVTNRRSSNQNPFIESYNIGLAHPLPGDHKLFNRAMGYETDIMFKTSQLWYCFIVYYNRKISLKYIGGLPMMMIS